MPDYVKTAKEKVASLGAMLGLKAKETAAAVVQASSGADGQLGVAKKEIASRKVKIDKAVDEATGMANGGKVKRRPQHC